MEPFGPLPFRQNVAVIDPHLDANDAERRMRFS
jgi:hypothetical protein